MRRGSYRDEAVVARTYDFSEADRVVVLVTRHHGVVRAVAKGVRRANSRFGSRLQPFVHLDVLLYEGRNLGTITQADTIAFLGAGVIENWDSYAAASAVVDAAERLMRHGDQDEELFHLTVNTLSAMQDTRHPTATLDAFLLQVMGLHGVAPSLFDCAVCQAPGPHHHFQAQLGGAVCAQCRTSISTSLPTEALRLMWLLQHNQLAPAERLLDSEDGPHLAAVAHRLTTTHLQWHTDSVFPALKYLNQQ